MKHFTLAILAAVSFSASAATPPAASGTNMNTGIITPDIVTDGLRTDRFTRTTQGATVFCPASATEFKYSSSVCLNGNTPAWVYARDLVPAGKTYVGFRIVSGSYGRAYYEIYWK